MLQFGNTLPRPLRAVSAPDIRAFPSIPARHDVARPVDCGVLAQRIVELRLDEAEAHEAAHDLPYRVAEQAYKL